MNYSKNKVAVERYSIRDADDQISIDLSLNSDERKDDVHSLIPPSSNATLQ